MKVRCILYVDDVDKKITCFKFSLVSYKSFGLLFSDGMVCLSAYGALYSGLLVAYVCSVVEVQVGIEKPDTISIDNGPP